MDIFFVGSQDQLADDFDRLTAKSRLPKAVGLPADNVHAHKSPGNRDKIRSDAAIRHPREWYRTDYEFIDVCKQVVWKNVR